MIDEVNIEFRKYIDDLSPNISIAFAVDCAEKSIPRYIDWSLDEGKGWGKPEVLQNAIKVCWTFVEDEFKDMDVFHQLNKAVSDITPDTEDFGDASGSGSLYAALSVGYAIDSIISADSAKCVLRCAGSALFASDYLLDYQNELLNFTNREHEEFEKERWTDEKYPLAREYQRQLKMLKFLAEWENPTITREQINNI